MFSILHFAVPPTSLIDQSLPGGTGSPNWRVRHSILLMLPRLAKVLKEDEPNAFQNKLDTAFGFKFFFNTDNTDDGEKALHAKYGKELNVLPWALDPIAQARCLTSERVRASSLVCSAMTLRRTSLSIRPPTLLLSALPDPQGLRREVQRHGDCARGLFSTAWEQGGGMGDRQDIASASLLLHPKRVQG